MEIHVTVNRKSFIWGNESCLAIKKFFEIENSTDEIFSKDNLSEMVKFYTSDDIKKVYELTCIIEKHNNLMDVKVSMFVEGEKGCHRLSFYMNDYEERKKGPAASKKALSALNYIAYMKAVVPQSHRKAC